MNFLQFKKIVLMFKKIKLVCAHGILKFCLIWTLKSSLSKMLIRIACMHIVFLEVIWVHGTSHHSLEGILFLTTINEFLQKIKIYLSSIQIMDMNWLLHHLKTGQVPMIQIPDLGVSLQIPYVFN